jgi:hypothetical protein
MATPVKPCAQAFDPLQANDVVQHCVRHGLKSVD